MTMPTRKPSLHLLVLDESAPHELPPWRVALHTPLHNCWIHGLVARVARRRRRSAIETNQSSPCIAHSSASDKVAAKWGRLKVQPKSSLAQLWLGSPEK